MNQKWCCPEFESQIMRGGEPREFGIAYLLSKNGARFTISKFEQRAEYPKTLAVIKFCPWCGRDLKQWFDSQVGQNSPKEEG